MKININKIFTARVSKESLILSIKSLQYKSYNSTKLLGSEFICGTMYYTYNSDEVFSEGIRFIKRRRD